MRKNNFKKYIYDVPDFPIKGVMFRDITPLLQDATSFNRLINVFVKEAKKIKKIDVVMGIDARGFLFASAVAYALKKGLAIIRKPGKLPRKTVKQVFSLEYGSSIFEAHTDSIKKGQNVLIIDDVLATGGSAFASAKIVEKLGGKVAKIMFLIEIKEFGGRKKLRKYDIFSALTF